MKRNFFGDVKLFMTKLYVLPFLLVLVLPSVSEGQTISGPEVKINGNDVMVSFSLGLNNQSIQEIREGIDKEFRYFVDLFRVWSIWPDEFVTGKLNTRTLRVDPIKKEFVATSFDGTVLTEKRFRSFESMLGWVLSVTDMKLAALKDLDPGKYFVRVTVESKIRKLPPVIGYLLIFVSENEFRIRKDSGYFTIESGK